MGLSVAISGGIMIVSFAMVMMMLPSIVENIYSIQQVSTSISEHNDIISKTDISTRRLETEIASPYVNFTLVNQGSNALWKFDSFNLYVEYDGAGPIKRTEELTFDGQCLGGLPQVRKWCIETITNDYKDPDILNLGEGARVRTHLSQNLATTNAVITVVTDNGVVNTSGYDFFDVSTLETLTNVTSTGCGLNQVIRVNSTGYWECATGINTLKKTADQTINAGAGVFTDVTDLTFPVKSGQDYAFKFYIIFQSAAAGTGFNCAVNGPAGTVDYFTTYQTVVNNPAGVAGWLQHHQVAFDASTLKTSTVTAGVDLIGCSIEGRFLAAADGTFAARFANELANNNIVVQKGSWGYWF
ncbi:MAG TPA: hypothetical protein VD731_01765 [Nitrosopumilaceae archaeon]|nr:hypothetical protein [Nitrosopumilaceae archaeon]